MRVKIMTRSKAVVLDYSPPDACDERVYTVGVDACTSSGDCRFTVVHTGQGRVWIGAYDIADEFSGLVETDGGEWRIMIVWPAGHPHPWMDPGTGNGPVSCAKGRGRMLLVQYGEAGHPLPTHPAIDSGMALVIRQMLDHTYKGEALRRYLCLKSGELYLLLQQLQEADKGKPALPVAITGKLESLDELVRQHPEENYSIQQLARHVHLNTTSLKKYFRGYFGAPIHQHLLRVKMEAAYRLLSSTTGPLKGIAYDLGYKNESNFSAAFHKFYGYPPGQVRKRV